jgi:hypothetical protein
MAWLIPTRRRRANPVEADHRTPKTQEEKYANAVYLMLTEPPDDDASANAHRLMATYAEGLDENTLEMCWAAAIERWEADQRPPRKGRFPDLLIRAWYIASFALLGIGLLARLVVGPIGEPWIAVGTFIIGAPLVWMILWFVYGWIWFALWLITWPIRPIRESRFMRFIEPRD